MTNKQGVQIAFAYISSYAAVSIIILIVERFGLPVDIGAWCSIFVSIALIKYISSHNLKYSLATIIILVSLILSTSLHVVQYILWLNPGNYAYNETNAIISLIQLTLTIIDILAMIWMISNGSIERSIKPSAMGSRSSRSVSTVKSYAMRHQDS